MRRRTEPGAALPLLPQPRAQHEPSTPPPPASPSRPPGRTYRLRSCVSAAGPGCSPRCCSSARPRDANEKRLSRGGPRADSVRWESPGPAAIAAPLPSRLTGVRRAESGSRAAAVGGEEGESVSGARRPPRSSSLDNCCKQRGSRWHRSGAK